MTSGRGLAVLAALTLAGCGPYPRDIGGTYERIERTQALRVGLAELPASDGAAARAYVARLERVTGAKATVVSGPAERQLARLENGDLDLVIGEFAEDSPWVAEFAILEPLALRSTGRRRLGLSPVARNGENRWIGVLEREIRNSEAGNGS